MSELALAKREELPVAQSLDIGQMLHAVINKGVNADNVAAVERLCDLAEKMERRNAEKDFNAAFVALQSETTSIKANRAVNNSEAKGGGVRFKFAAFEDIMREVQPRLLKHGFTVSFSQKYDGPRIIETCTLRHTSGHSVSNDFAVRIGGGPPGASETQSDGAAATYAKRFALCNALNIVVEGLDTDAGIVGKPITKEQAKSLRKRVQDTASDEVAFLKVADAKTYDEIQSGKYSMLDAMLRRKEKTA